MTTTLTIAMPGLPVAWSRAGRKGMNITFTPKKQRSAMGELKAAAAKIMDGRPPLDGALAVSMTFQYPWPKSMSAKRRADPVNRWRSSRPDIDNLFKLVGDGLNCIVWSDDGRIAKGTVSKIYGDTAQTLIEVSPV